MTKLGRDQGPLGAPPVGTQTGRKVARSLVGRLAISASSPATQDARFPSARVSPFAAFTSLQHCRPPMLAVRGHLEDAAPSASARSPRGSASLLTAASPSSF